MRSWRADSLCLRRARSRNYPMLQKSPRRSCRIKIRNNRIGANGFLNQRCALTPDLESILRTQTDKIVLQQNRHFASFRGDAPIRSRIGTCASRRASGTLPHTRLRYQCSPYHTNSALRPFIAQLERAAGFKADDTSEQRLDKLEALLAMGASPVQAVAPLFAALLSIPFGERYPPLALSPARQRRRTLAALLDQFGGLARQQPILLSFEDAHWADATSLELLDLTVERVRQLPVLALFTFRPEFEPPWVGLPNVGTLTLGRLDRNGVESMVARVTGGRVPPPEG